MDWIPTWTRPMTGMSVPDKPNQPVNPTGNFRASKQQSLTDNNQHRGKNDQSGRPMSRIRIKIGEWIWPEGLAEIPGVGDKALSNRCDREILVNR